jgi:hypothetical protein
VTWPYGPAHRARRKLLEPLVASGAVACARCGEPIEPSERWHLDHDDIDKTKYIGASHERCNCQTETHRRTRITSRNWL